jgi:Ca2+-binding RTX toxin-like protein
MDVDLTGAGTALTSITLSGRNDVTVELDGGDLETREAADLLAGDTFELGLDTTGLTNGATSTINVSTAFGGANASLAKVDVDVIELSATSTADNVTVKSGSTVLISADQTALTIDGADATASSNTIAVNIDDGVDSAAASAAAMTSLAFTDFGSVVINNGLDTLADGTAETVTMNTLTSADGGITLNLGANDLINDTVMGVTTAHNIVVTGSGDVDFTNSAVTAKVLDASAVTGDVTANLLKSDQVATVKTGAGDDTLTTTAAAAAEVDMSISAGAGDDEITLHTAAGTVNSLTIDGGDGDDTLNIADGGDHQATGAGEVVTITGIENIVLAGDADLSTSFMNNASFNMESAAGADAIGVIVETGDTAIDISGLTTTAANAAANAADTYTVSAALSTTVTAITGTDIALNALTAGDIVGATLTGGALADTLNGGAKADTIVGGAGVDTIDGNGGADTIDGGAGADEITGGTGADTLTGGADADDFNFVTGDTGITLATADTITDFVTASDQIDVTMTGALGAADAVVLDGSAIASFTAMVTAVDAIFAAGGGNNDDVVAYYDALGTGNAYVFVDEDNSGAFAAGDTLIVLTGINAASELAASDFIS